MIALIDGDIVAYRCAASAENEERDIAFIRTRVMMKDILDEVNATSHKVFLSGAKENNFRNKVDPEYKANRKDIIRPQHLEATKEFLVTNWQAQVCNGYEADDGLGMEQKEEGTVICSIDKDLLQVPGWHYNFVKKEMVRISQDEGFKRFYLQVLTGDRTDNVFGLPGIGPVKANKLLEGLLPEEYYDACRAAYNDDERFHKNCKLLWVWREANQVWEPPKDYAEKEKTSKEEIPKQETPIQV